MKSKFLSAFLLAACFLLPAGAKAKQKKAEEPLGWGYASKGPVDVRPGFMSRKSPVVHLGRGGLMTILEDKSKNGRSYARVRTVNPATMASVTGWADMDSIEKLPISAYPPDDDLLKQMGGEYLQDFTASNARIARYVLRQGQQAPALVCFIGAQILPTARLQVFVKSGGKYVPGAYIDFPISEMKFAITDLEVRDLMGDGNECLITHEPFRVEAENEGVKLVIRRLEASELVTLWEAPIEFLNKASYLPHQQILTPPESNIGAAGTETSGTVEYRMRGRVSEPVWKGKVDFFVVGREDPVDTVKIEKTCPWDGFKFAPLN